MPKPILSRAEKISRTMKARKIDNFKHWRDGHPVYYACIPYSGDLAEYIGVILGDGNIEATPRTERLIIVGNSSNPGFIERYSKLTYQLFGKKPTITKIKTANAFRISLYQKYISQRLGIITGNKESLPYILPIWIEENDLFSIRFLRGLFEAEGSLNIHLPTCTYNFSFSNHNVHLLNIVERLLRRLEFHPEVRNNAIRIRRRAEVEKLRKLIAFREY